MFSFSTIDQFMISLELLEYKYEYNWAESVTVTGPK